MYRCDPGTTGFSVLMRLRSATTGLPVTGLAYNSAGATGSYTRHQQASVNVPLVSLASPSAPWAAGGFVEVDAVKQAGLYRFDQPNAALLAGAPYVVPYLAFTNVIADGTLIRLETTNSLAGSGASAYTVTVTDNSSTPLQGARVWVSTDAGGTNVIAGTIFTDSNGHATFYLNPGQYYLWVADQGFTGSNPTAITVT